MNGQIMPDFSINKTVHEQTRLAILTYLAGSREKKHKKICGLDRVR